MRYVIALALAGLLLCACSSAHARYHARVESKAALSPAMLAVTIRVTNTGTAPGAPECTIEARSNSSRATGVDVAGVRKLPPHHTTTFVADLTITLLGARRINHVTVRCS